MPWASEKSVLALSGRLWRRRAGSAAARLDVAGSISKVIAQSSLDAPANQVFVSGRATLPLGPAIAEGVRACTTAIGANISESLIAAIKPTALRPMRPGKGTLRLS